MNPTSMYHYHVNRLIRSTNNDAQRPETEKKDVDHDVKSRESVRDIKLGVRPAAKGEEVNELEILGTETNDDSCTDHAFDMTH